MGSLGDCKKNKITFLSKMDLTKCTAYYKYINLYIQYRNIIKNICNKKHDLNVHKESQKNSCDVHGKSRTILGIICMESCGWEEIIFRLLQTAKPDKNEAWLKIARNKH